MNSALPRTVKFILIVVGLISLSVLFGWFMDIPALVQVHSAFAPMQFNTAICFLAATLAFLVKYSNRRLSLLLASFPMLIGSLTAIQYALNIDLQIDELFMDAYITVKTTHPGRMSPITAINFMLFSVYVLLFDLKIDPGLKKMLRTICLVPVLYLSMTALFRYLLGEVSPYAWQVYTQMAVHTSFGFLCLSASAFLIKLAQYGKIERQQILESVGLSVSIYLVFVLFSTNLSRQDKQASDALFRSKIDSITNESSISLKLQVNALERLARRIGKMSYNGQSKLSDDASQYLKHFTDIQAIEWVNRENRVEWIVPIEGNRSVIGKTLNQDRSRKNALDRALKSGRPTFSPVIDLLQGGKGCLLFIPVVTTSGSPRGYLVTVYKVENLAKTILGSRYNQFQLQVFQNGQQIANFKKESNSRSLDLGMLSINDYGLNWKLFLERSDAFKNQEKSYYPELILLLGTLVSFFLGNVIYLIRRISVKNLEIRRVAQIKTDFLANMSHEIRTPLNGVIGLTELLEESVESSENKTKIKLMKRSADSLLALVNDILDLSKLEDGKIDLETRPFNIKTIAEEVLRLFEPLAGRKNIQINVEFGHLITPDLYGDDNRIKQILSNLISNAIKFTSRGEVKLTIDQKKSSENDRIETSLIISDTGIGIPLDKQDQVFEKFTQADTAVNRRYGGTGLGLSISRSLTIAMGGTISMESQPEHGSVFTVTLPLESVTQNKEVNAPLNTEHSNSLLKDAHILVAEDNEINQIVIKGMIKKMGLSCDVVENGHEALRSLEKDDYDLVLMDCQMPEMDGYTATQKIIELKGSKRPPIVAITASSNEEDIKRCYRAGMDDVLSKPLNFQEMKCKVRDLIHRNG